MGQGESLALFEKELLSQEEWCEALFGTEA
jgi:hypothetical protein